MTDPVQADSSERSGQTNRVLIGGYYGHGNLGDEAILHVLLEQLRAAFPNFSAVVASGDPEGTRRVHHVDAVSERDIPALLEAAAASDLILLGGGGLFQDYQDVDPATLLTELHWGLTYFDAFPALAILTRKPFVIYAVGVGPLTTPDGRRYTRLAFERADAATVRDAESLDILRGIGAPIERVRVTADPAFLIGSAAAGQIEALLGRLGFDKRPARLVAVALREWDTGAGGDWTGAVAEALDRFVDAHDASLLFIPFQSQGLDAGTNDLAAAERVCDRMRQAGRATISRLSLDPPEVSGLFGACDLVLAMRLHATIFAADAGVPMVALAYDPKVAAAMDRLGMQSFSLAISDITAEGLFERLDACYRDRAALGARLKSGVPSLRSAAAASTADLVDWLSRRSFEPRPASPEWTGLLGAALVRRVRQVEGVEARATLLASAVETANARIVELTTEVETAHARAAQLTTEAETANARVAQLTVETVTARTAELASELTVDHGRAGGFAPDIRGFTPGAPQPAADAEQAASLCAELSRALALANQARLGEMVALASGGDAARRHESASARAVSIAAQTLQQELRTIRSSRAWRAISAYRRLRHAVNRAWRHPRAGVARAARTALKPSGRDLLRRALGRRWMNPYAYVFDLYRRARAATYGPHLAGVRAPGEIGLVSIVLPVYNGAAMVSSAIESVLGQTYRHFELIIVDDGSTDETPRVINDYARRDPRVRIIRQENQKLPRALSRGFGEARGEFLTWTSCDNLLKPACLEKLVACLDRHPHWDMIYANIDLIGEDGRYLRGSSHYEGYQRPHGSEHVHLPDSTGELNVWPNNSIGAAFLYRSRVAALLGDYSPVRFVSEDYDYWMRVNALFTLRHADFDEPIYDYRFHTQSLTSRWAELQMLENRERLMVFEDFRRDFYLSPMVWVVDGPEAETAAVRTRIRELGHLLYDETYSLDSLPHLFVPVVYVRVAGGVQAATAPRADLPSYVLRVLVTTDAVLPEKAAAEWDLCCALGAPRMLPRLDRPRQGWLAATDVGALTHAIDIRAKSESLARFEAETAAPRPASLAASVVVCTHRFSPRVVSTIRSVLRQQFDHPYELLVVDNAPPSVELAKALTALRSQLPPDHPARVRLVACPVIGLSAARNAGLAEAAGEIVCFLDDDAVADERWLARLHEAFEAHPDAGIIGGHIHLKIPEPRPRALRPGWEKYWSHFVTGFEEYTEVRNWWEFPWGASWAARRSALLLAGGFRSRYGRVGDNAWGGEEVVAAMLVRRLGFAVAVLPQAAVLHDVDPSRFTFLHVLRTLVAGHQVAYLAQRDLYVPREGGMRATLRQIMTQHVDRSIPSPERRLRNVAYRKLAQVRLLTAQARDASRRLRKAVVVTDPGEGAK